MMTKKHFIKVAEILNLNICSSDSESWDNSHFDLNLLDDFCEWFKSENPNFDEAKFRDAILK